MKAKNPAPADKPKVIGKTPLIQERVFVFFCRGAFLTALSGKTLGGGAVESSATFD
jgi:hypothetical protein